MIPYTTGPQQSLPSAPSRLLLHEIEMKPMALPKIAKRQSNLVLEVEVEVEVDE